VFYTIFLFLGVVGGGKMGGLFWGGGGGGVDALFYIII